MGNISDVGKKCFGCRSCEQVCPKHCINIELTKEGFAYPVIEKEKCIQCGLCLKVCPTERVGEHRNKPQHVWAFKNKNAQEILRSSSGGAADVAVGIVIRQGGVVYGAAYDEKLAVRHIEVEDEEGKAKLQSSKYVQSDINNCYSKAKKALSDGRTVLFTGTPCQIAGLYAFLGGEKHNLYTIDLICHGVPSPKFFKKYLEYQGRQKKDKVVYFNFRSKEKRGWGTQYLLKTKNKSETKALTLDRYGKHFMMGDCYRECCYQCPFANTARIGDITVGDFWGIAKSHPDFYSSQGVSSVFVNTDKGTELFEHMKKLGDTIYATLEEGMVKQHNLVKPTVRPESRRDFYKNIDDADYIDKMKVGIQMKERIKSALPTETIKFIKTTLGGVNDKVTVIIPIYNVAPFLENCIESVCTQTYTNLEIILVDDGSEDESGKICDRFAEADERIKVIHKKNNGVSAARNSGIEAAHGDWICFVDGDDFVMPNYVSYMLALAKYYDADISLTTQMFGNFDETQEAEDNVSQWTNEDAVEAILCYRVSIGCYCKLFKSTSLEKIRFIPEVFIGEGFNFNISMFQKADKIVSGRIKTYYYRRDNPTSAMTKFSIRKCECGLRALELIKEHLEIHTKRIELAWKFANWRTHSDFYDMCVLAKAQKKYPDMYRKCLSVTRHQALIALKVPTTRQNRIRAVIMWVCPIIIPFAMMIRKRRYHVDVSNL